MDRISDALSKPSSVVRIVNMLKPSLSELRGMNYLFKEELRFKRAASLSDWLTDWPTNELNEWSQHEFLVITRDKNMEQSWYIREVIFRKYSYYYPCI
jgi:hypothetical protein